MSILKIDHLSKRYGSQYAIKDISLEVEKGQVYGLLGPNGSGKTTTLGIILGVLSAQSGSYSWFDQGQKASLRKNIGSLLEKPNFAPWLNSFDNLRIVASIKGKKTSETELESIIKDVNLWHGAYKKFAEYSLGMKQRLAIAAALLGDPEVLLLDEPTNGIDAEGIIEIRGLIKKMAKKGKTVILASHILDEVEKVCTNVAILKKGTVLQEGAIKDVLTLEDTIELASHDRETLKRALSEWDGVQKIEDGEEFIKVYLNKEVDATALNRYLIERDIVLSHLYQRKKSLESHFLELLGENE